MASFVLRVLSLTLGIFFIFIGTLKLTPSINDDLYREMRKSFIRGVKVFPFAKITGWKPNAHLYRKAIGGAEVLCGVILVAVPGPLKEAANILMIILSGLDIYTHYALNESLDRSSLSLVFIMLLICRLIVYLQIKAKENEEKIAQLKPAETSEDISADVKKSQ